ncbi:RNA recognition motif domain [Dillenia turbinata]|uniref:RNA recognition motif domain n=1 Tax=Dillenia turbinata TaxID=194707 RepID=A0AAN8VWU9_9MAGN
MPPKTYHHFVTHNRVIAVISEMDGCSPTITLACMVETKNIKSLSLRSGISGLCYDTNEPILKDAFGKYGEIIEVKVICDHLSGKSKGYGFVQFKSESAACTALKEMDGQLLDGWNIRVDYANKG